MKLYVLDNGRIVMVGDNPVTDGSDENGEAPAIPVHSFLIQTEDHNILFDTGCHPEGMTGAWPVEMTTNPYECEPEQQLLARLDQLGLKPEDIDTIIVSHLHLDHAGGVYLFPEAKVFVDKGELDRVLSDDEKGTLDIFHVQCDVDNWKKVGTKWEPIPTEQKETKLCDGVTILNFGPGHSFGMLGVFVELKDRNMLLVSDAAYNRKFYGPPAALSGAVEDQEGYFATMEYIREYAKEHGAEVYFGHDMDQYKTLIKSTEGYYE